MHAQPLRLDETSGATVVEPGSRETAVVTVGRVALARDGRVHEPAQGDAVTFDADLPHRFENAGEGQASFLAVVAAGLRRS